MKLIIAEKPDVAKHIAAALSLDKKGGYYEGKGMLLTNMRGHLFTASNHSTYTGVKGWVLDKLPILPESLSIEVSEDEYAKKQIKLIGELLQKSTEVINAMDSDREGEAIFRNLKKHFNIQDKNIKRLWIEDLSSSTIIKAMDNLYNYDDVEIKALNTNLYRLSEASELRGYLDWVVGINATQFMSLKYGQGKQLSLGRVQTAVLKIIGDRYWSNKNHTKSYTYRIIAKHQHSNTEFNTSSAIYETKEEAENVFKTLGNNFECTNFEIKSVEKDPSLLFDLNSLIISANKLFKYKGSEVLDAAQSLYEKKLISYPRTDCRYIKKERYEEVVKPNLSAYQTLLSINNYLLNENPKCVNNDKVDSSHDAIICIAPLKNEVLSKTEKDIYYTIAMQMLSSLGVPALYTNKKIILKNGDTEFIGTSSEVQDRGHENIKRDFLTNYLGKNSNDSENEDIDNDDISSNNEVANTTIPRVSIGEKLLGNLKIKDIESKPKPIFNVATLTNALMKILTFLKEEGEDIEDLKKHINFSDVGLGTENTRVHIVERLIDIGFVEIKHNKYYLTELGQKMYEMVKDTIIAKVSNTARMEVDLKLLEKNMITYEELKSKMKLMVNDILQDLENVKASSNINQRESFGKCPNCQKGDINEYKKSFSCNRFGAEEEPCKFSIWKEIAGKSINKKMVVDLITNQKTGLIKGFKKRSGEGTFDAKLALEKKENILQVIFEFEPKKNK